MTKYFFILLLVSILTCRAQQSVIRDNVSIDVYSYKAENATKAAAMPEIKKGSALMKYKRRCDYLLINISEMHQPHKAEERKEIFDLYPDTLKIEKLYLEKFVLDKKLQRYFEETVAPITNPNLERTKTYTIDELMEVASKFFYCDKINTDTTVQSHVCIGINGVKEAQWNKDYTLLAAFCYEAIFNDFDKDTSLISDSYDLEKKAACKQFRKSMTTLDKYLEDVKLDLFARMKHNVKVKEELLAYYELNKSNLAFKLLN